MIKTLTNPASRSRPRSLPLVAWDIEAKKLMPGLPREDRGGRAADGGSVSVHRRGAGCSETPESPSADDMCWDYRPIATNFGEARSVRPRRSTGSLYHAVQRRRRPAGVIYRGDDGAMPFRSPSVRDVYDQLRQRPRPTSSATRRYITADGAAGSSSIASRPQVPDLYTHAQTLTATVPRAVSRCFRSPSIAWKSTTATDPWMTVWRFAAILPAGE